MARFTVSRAITIPASASELYHILADYTEGHPAILPERYFRRLTVEEGGLGEGTVIRVEMNLLGRLRTFRAVVSEPALGRVLVERDLANGTVTTFTVEPIEGRRAARVSISTELVPPAGLIGQGQRLLASVLLRRVFDEELEQLAVFVRQRARARARRRALAGAAGYCLV